MNRLPSWSPLVISVPASVAAAYWLPRPAAIGAITALLLGAFSWPAFQRWRGNRCKVCKGQCRYGRDRDGETLTEREIGVLSSIIAATYAREQQEAAGGER